MFLLCLYESALRQIGWQEREPGTGTGEEEDLYHPLLEDIKSFFSFPKKILIDIVMRMRYYDGVETGVGERKLPRYKLLSLRDPLQSDGYRGV